MTRRKLFGSLVTVVASALALPLAKLLPKKEPKIYWAGTNVLRSVPWQSLSPATQDHIRKQTNYIAYAEKR